MLSRKELWKSKTTDTIHEFTWDPPGTDRKEKGTSN